MCYEMLTGENWVFNEKKNSFYLDVFETYYIIDIFTIKNYSKQKYIFF